MYNMKKQTAVEWMVEQVELISNNKTLSKKDAVKLYDEVIQKAKAMEKEQTIKSMEIAFNDMLKIQAGGESPYKDWEQYFQETYGGDK